MIFRSLFGAKSSLIKRLEALYAKANQHYLDQLRDEQENFLSAYKFLTSVVTRVKSLLDLSEDYEEVKMNNFQASGAKFKKVIDFVKLNFGSIEWEMEGFKRKIMVIAPPKANALPFSRSNSEVKPTVEVKQRAVDPNFDTIIQEAKPPVSELCTIANVEAPLI